MHIVLVKTKDGLLVVLSASSSVCPDKHVCQPSSDPTSSFSSFVSFKVCTTTFAGTTWNNSCGSWGPSCETNSISPGAAFATYR